MGIKCCVHFGWRYNWLREMIWTVEIYFVKGMVINMEVHKHRKTIKSGMNMLTEDSWWQFSYKTVRNLKTWLICVDDTWILVFIICRVVWERQVYMNSHNRSSEQVHLVLFRDTTMNYDFSVSCLPQVNHWRYVMKGYFSIGKDCQVQFKIR